MSKSDALENALLDLVLGGGSYTPPANVWVALYTEAPTDAGGGLEVSGPGYDRVQVANDATQWPAAASGLKSNGEWIDFPPATGVWGTVVAFAIHEHATNDDILYWGLVVPNRLIADGAEPSFAPGTLVISEN